jgi:hypothetical protein
MNITTNPPPGLPSESQSPTNPPPESQSPTNPPPPPNNSLFRLRRRRIPVRRSVNLLSNNKSSNNFLKQQIENLNTQLQLIRIDLENKTKYIKMLSDVHDKQFKNSKEMINKLDSILRKNIELTKRNVDLTQTQILYRAEAVYFETEKAFSTSKINYLSSKLIEMQLLIEKQIENDIKQSKTIEEYHKKIRCSVCMDKRANCVIAKCTHCILCSDCTYTILNNNNDTNSKKCPICRIDFDQADVLEIIF